MQNHPPNGGGGGDDRRYPTHPPPRSSFMGHHLPPPIPSASSPHTYPSPGGGHTDPAGWASERDRNGRRYSPVMPHFDRPPSSSSRLPPFESYHRSSVPGWDIPTSGFPTWNTRPSISSYSPPKPSAVDPAPLPSIHRNPSITGTPQPVQQSPIPTKHSATDDASSAKKKKRRVALSCAECAKRKQRCNRETPCQHCVARRVPELCIPYSRVSSPPPRLKRDGIKEEAEKDLQPRVPSALPTLSVRVSRIEALLNVVVNRVDGVDGKALSDWRISESSTQFTLTIDHAPATSPPPRHSSLTISRRESIRGGSPSASPSPPPTANEEQESADVEGGSRSGDVEVLDLDSSMRNPLPQLVRTLCFLSLMLIPDATEHQGGSGHVGSGLPWYARGAIGKAIPRLGCGTGEGELAPSPLLTFRSTSSSENCPTKNTPIDSSIGSSRNSTMSDTLSMSICSEKVS